MSAEPHQAHPDHPWLAAVSDLLRRWPPGALPPIAELQAALGDRLAPLGLSLVPSSPAPRRRKAAFDPKAIYELRIADTGEIPTRPGNLHDLCNALSWAAFPRAKWALTRRIAELQRARLEATGRLPEARDREHDRLAMLDEGGMITLAGAAGSDGASDGDDGIRDERAVLVGHALWQHAAEGRRQVRAAAVRLAAPAPRWATAGCDEVRAAVDAAWLGLVTSPEALHAAMADRAGVLIDDGALWRPAGDRRARPRD